MPRPQQSRGRNQQRGLPRTSSSSIGIAPRGRSPRKPEHQSPGREVRSRQRDVYRSPRRKSQAAGQVFYNTVHASPLTLGGIQEFLDVSEGPLFDEEAMAANNVRLPTIRNARQDDQSQDVLMRSSTVVLSVAFLMLLGVACVVVAHRTGGQIPALFSLQVPIQTEPGGDVVTERSQSRGQVETKLNAPSNQNTIPTPPGVVAKAPRRMQGVLGAFFRKTQPPSVLGYDYECSTSSCSKEGERLASLVDPLLSPCDNFYEHVCANWIEEHPVPRGGGHVSYRSTLVEFVEKRLDEFIRAELHKMLATPLSFNVLSSHGKAVLMRNACMEVERMNDRGLHPLKEAFEHLHLLEWPTVKIEFNASIIEKVAGALASRLGIFPLVSVHVQRDPDNSENFIIALDVPSREIVRRTEFFQNQQEMLEYENLVRKAFDKLSNPALSDILGSAVLGLEDEVSHAMTPKLLPEDQVRRYVKMSVSELPYCSKVRWLRFLNKTFEKVRHIHRDDVVLVKNLPFLKKLVEVLEGRQRRTIANYLGFKAFLAFSLLLPPRSEGEIATFYGKLLTGRSHKLPRWRLCLRMAEDAMPFTFLSIYHDMFVKDHNVLQLRSSLSRMKDFLGSSIESIEWMSSRDAPKQLDKLKQLDFVEFFPAWVLSEDQRDLFYETVQYVPVGNVLLSFMNAKTAHVTYRFRNLLHGPKQMSWFGSVFDVEATYDPLNNTIYVPMAMFAEPMGFDSIETPLYIPRVLVDVAHILMGVVSGLGSLFSTRNKVHEWWTSVTKASYREYTACLAAQYNGTLSVSQPGAVYGDFTVEPDARDNAAVPFLYEVYKRNLKDRGVRGHFLLAGMPNTTSEQLFFLAYAMRFCENANEAYVGLHLRNVPLALPVHRVNIPLWNSAAFAEAYYCRKGSNMNPVKKCKFWKFQ